jgi:DNA modification methylase
LPHKEVSLARAKGARSNKHKYINVPGQTMQGISKPRSNKNKGIGAMQPRQFDGGDYMVGLLHPLGKNPGDVWEIPTQPFPEAHFATFPEKLINPMIKAACPQWVCRKCQKPRVRIMKTEYKIKGNSISRSIKERKEKEVGLVARNFIGDAKHYTIGWTNCDCKLENKWQAGIVLDPFMGSGTTGYVSEKLQRNWIGIELNQLYAKMAEKRIRREKRRKKLKLII